MHLDAWQLVGPLLCASAAHSVGCRRRYVFNLSVWMCVCVHAWTHSPTGLPSTCSHFDLQFLMKLLAYSVVGSAGSMKLVSRLTVCLSAPSFVILMYFYDILCRLLRRVCCCRPGSQKTSTDCCTARSSSKCEQCHVVS